MVWWGGRAGTCHSGSSSSRFSSYSTAEESVRLVPTNRNAGEKKEAERRVICRVREKESERRREKEIKKEKLKTPKIEKIRNFKKENHEVAKGK